MRCLLLTISILCVGCTSDPGFTPAQRLAGEWTSSMDGARVTMSSDGTWIYASIDENGNIAHPGTFEATWDTITLRSDNGPCRGMEGRYEYDLSMDTILFTLAHDECDGRRLRMDYAWTRAMSPNIPAVKAGTLEAITEEQESE